MKPSTPSTFAGQYGFDRLAPCYHALERLAFGRSLEAARFTFIDRLAGCRRILVLGDGDGRFVARLVKIARTARITSIDASAAMLARARTRLTDDERLRVDFVQADARGLDLPPAAFDAVVTLFFLDCFSEADLSRMIARVTPALASDARWLFADFALPPRGWRRLRARAWIASLYAFFCWETGIEARELPAMEDALRTAEFRVEAEVTLQAGLLRTVCFRRSG